jgi:hypothetical protein
MLDGLHGLGDFCDQPSARSARSQRVADWICDRNVEHPVPDFHVTTWRTLQRMRQ